MKRLLTSSVVLLFAIFLAKAGPVSLSQAKSSAQKALQSSLMAKGKGTNANQQQLTLAYTQTADKTITGTKNYPLYYAFDKADGNGFVIVSGDDRTDPILAITDEGSFDKDTPNPGFNWWLEAMTTSMQRIAEGETTAEQAQEKITAVAPLIKTRWNQGTPFNNVCPIDTAKGCTGDTPQRSVTGCVATALAQILYYWQYPKTVSAIVKYTDKGNQKYHYPVEREVNLANYPFDYAKMRTNYDSNIEWKEEETKDIANLMYVCGIGMYMNYCKTESGTNINSEQLNQIFGYDKSCRSIERVSFTADEWIKTLAAELEAGRPILYRASKEGGHQFVCDGIDEDGKIHFNWGWGGHGDGFYDIRVLQPFTTMQGYTTNQAAVIGITPDKGGEATHISNDVYYESLSVNILGNNVLSDNSTVVLDSYVYNITATENGYNGCFGYILYDSNGKVIEKDKTYDDPDKLLPNAYYTYWRYANLRLTQAYKDGIYYLVPAAGKSQEDLQPITGGSTTKTYKDYAFINIKNRTVSAGISGILDPADIALSAKTTVGEDTLYAGKTLPATFTITNNGEYFKGYLDVKYKNTGETDENYVDKSIPVELEKGETRTVNINVLGSQESDLPLEIYAYQMAVTDKVNIGEITYHVKKPTEGQADLYVENVEILTPKVAINDEVKVKVTINNKGGLYYGALKIYIIPSSLLGTAYSYYTGETQNFIIDNEVKTFTFSVPVYANFDLHKISEGKAFLTFNLKSGKRYEFEVVNTATGISDIEAESTQKDSSMIYNINGQPMGRDMDSLPKGIYIQNGKKKIKK